MKQNENRCDMPLSNVALRNKLTRWREKTLLFRCAENHQHSHENCGLDKIYSLFHGSAFNELWRSNMRLKSNRDLPDLDKCEGGMGGDRNDIDRQLRYPVCIFSNSKYIKIFLKNPGNASSFDVWSEFEIRDLISSFILTASSLDVKVYCFWNKNRYYS